MLETQTAAFLFVRSKQKPSPQLELQPVSKYQIFGSEAGIQYPENAVKRMTSSQQHLSLWAVIQLV